MFGIATYNRKKSNSVDQRMYWMLIFFWRTHQWGDLPLCPEIHPNTTTSLCLCCTIWPTCLTMQPHSIKTECSGNLRHDCVLARSHPSELFYIYYHWIWSGTHTCSRFYLLVWICSTKTRNRMKKKGHLPKPLCWVWTSSAANTKRGFPHQNEIWCLIIYT